MKSLPMIQIGAIQTSLNSWKAMPKASKTPDGYSLVLDGETLKAPAVALTGGGQHPAYTYIQRGDAVQWFAGHIASGTAVTTVAPTPTPATVTPQADAPKAEKSSKKK